MTLRAELEQIAFDRSLDVLDRSIAVTALLTEALEPLRVEPVLVGGMAVLYWTGAPEFLTADIDLVMDDPPATDRVLRDLGFEQAADGRHWRLSGTEVLVELPGRHLPPGALSEVVTLNNGRSIRVLSQVDVLIVRIEELAIGPNELVARQVLALVPGSDRTRLRARAAQVGASPLLERFLVVADEVLGGVRAVPDADELYDLVRGV